MDRLVEIPSGFGLWLELNEAFLPILLFMIFQSASKILQNFEYDVEKFGKKWEKEPRSTCRKPIFWLILEYAQNIYLRPFCH